MKRATFRTVLLVLVLCGTVLSPPDLFARTPSSAGTSSDLDEAESLQARDEGGYVDMDKDGEGDRFVDEDGDGIDDRRMRRHQKRNRQRWGDEQQRGNVSGDGGQGAGGSKGYGAVQVRVRAAVGGKTLRTALLCMLFLVCPLGESMAAFEGEVGVEGTWTDNLYLTASSEDDFVTTPFGYVEGPLGRNFGLRYGIDGYFYGTNSELNALWQRAGVWHRARVGGKVDLEAGLGYSGILHVSDSKNLDHHQVGGTVDLDLRPSERLLIVPRIEGIWRIYPNTDDLDYIEAIGSLLANRSFETQTTLRLNGTIYFRRFLQSVSETGEIEASRQPDGRRGPFVCDRVRGGESFGPGRRGPGERCGAAGQGPRKRDGPRRTGRPPPGSDDPGKPGVPVSGAVPDRCPARPGPGVNGRGFCGRHLPDELPRPSPVCRGNDSGSGQGVL